MVNTGDVRGVIMGLLPLTSDLTNPLHLVNLHDSTTATRS